MVEKDPDVSLSQLRCFVAVADALSLAEAGRRLGMSAASVSKSLSRLEESAGLRLIHRSTHAISLTADGEVLLETAREAIAAASRFRSVATNASDAGGTIRISAPVALCRVVLAPLLARFRQLHPAVLLDVRATNEIVSLADGGIDIALRSGSLSRVPGHIQQRWFSAPWVFCASPGYLRARGTPKTIEELEGHDLIGFRNTRTGQVHSWPHQSSGKSARILPTSKLIFDDGDSAWQAALAGGGIACPPLWLAAQAIRADQAVEVLRDAREQPVDISILRQERHLTPSRVRALIDYLVANGPALGDLV